MYVYIMALTIIYNYKASIKKDCCEFQLPKITPNFKFLKKNLFSDKGENEKDNLEFDK